MDKNCCWQGPFDAQRKLSSLSHHHTAFPRIAILAACLFLLPVLSKAAQPTLERRADGVALHLPGGELRLEVLSDTVVRIAYAKSPEFFNRASIDAVPRSPSPAKWRITEGPATFTLSTARLRVIVDRRSGAVSFATADGHTIAAETPASRIMEPATVQGESTFHIQQKWKARPDESLYGLGQMQLGTTDIKGYDVDMWQHNTNVVVPFLVSSRGYGILWDNTSFTRFGDLRPFEPIPADDLFDKSGRQGGLTVAPLDGSEPPRQTAEITVSMRLSRAQSDHPETAPGTWHLKGQSWEGAVLAPTTGDYQFQAYSNGGIKVWLAGKLVMDHWRQNWLTSNDQIRLHLEAGRKYPIRIENDPEQQSTLQFSWKTPAPDADTSLWSQVGEGVDYYFVYGPSIDQVIAGYRLITGNATMLPNWTFGLWQSRQRYETADQSLDVVKQFRDRKIPFDNIVQDWQYWRPDAWGSHQFDPTRFPDPEGWIKAIHAQHAHLMISVWGKFNPDTENAREMDAKGYLYQPNLKENIKDWIRQPYTFYDAFNPGARKLFWSQVNMGLFSKGVDAWWMDATEPDLMPSPPTLEGQQSHMNPTYLGTGSRMLNGYALVNSEGVYVGQRQAAPNERVFILTRSGFAGQQRYSAVTWSGDITSTWTAMAKQIPAGLGASISGLPYWTMDTGGYTMQRKFSQEPMTADAEDEWRELNARWFELSTFTPILRVHGELRPREMWTLGNNTPAYNAELKFDRLRYALFPYIYSQAGWITQSDYTMMRPMVMDFPADRTARELSDEYMFGPALLVAPITKYKQRARTVYLPPGSVWYDFWSGQPAKPGTISAPAPYDQIPIFVRAGSIVPSGPEMQYIGEKSSDPTVLHVYAGTNGRFTLYEDQGTTFDYEKGEFSEIPIVWNEQTGTLTIGKRVGSYDGMLTNRTFQAVLVSKTHPSGFSLTPTSLQSAQYSGNEIRLKLR
jgi:alpha-D-xyloside xylohydrolase